MYLIQTPRNGPAAISLLTLVATAILATALAASADAQVRHAPVVLTDAGLERIRSEVSIRIDGATRVAHYEVQEEFHNGSHRLMEADYLYPVPRGAVFQNLSLFAGEVELRGEMMRGEEARSIYEEIVRRRRDPALVELAGQDLLRARVFPIEPGQSRKIILRYTQILPADAGIVKLRHPQTGSVLVPRADNAGELGPIEGDRGLALPRLVTITLDRASGFATPVSPTHSIDLTRQGSEQLQLVARLEAGSGDFVLLLPRASSEVEAGLVTHSLDPEREAGHFMLLVTPPLAADPIRIPRDLTLVLDVSGSMSGRKIEQARSALAQMLRGLDASDRFRLITFSAVVRSFRPELVAATPQNVRDAVSFLHAVAADGSTNVAEALRVALGTRQPEGRTAQVVLLTDGRPTAGETEPERIAASASASRHEERIFAFGVGEDVNTYLLDHLVASGRGSVAYVRPEESVEAAVGTLNRRIGSPILTDLRIVQSPVEMEELFPDPLPDLFHGEELTLLGRYRGAGTGALVLEGQRGGSTMRLRYWLDFPRRRTQNEFVGTLWAARKAGALTARIRLHGPDRELVTAVRDLGLRYGILTEYTAYLVQEPDAAGGRVAEDAALDRAQQAARAPAQQAGAGAFREARRSARLRSASSTAEAEEMVADALAPQAGEWQPAMKRVGSRRFVLRDEVWRDLAHDPVAEVVRIAPFSAAWIELSQWSDDLRAALALGERVIIAGDALTLTVEPGGAGQLDARSRERLRRAFPTSGS